METLFYEKSTGDIWSGALMGGWWIGHERISKLVPMRVIDFAVSLEIANKIYPNTIFRLI
jgi:hypothetical protein